MKEQSKFYSSLGWLVLLNIIVKPVWIFLIDRQVQNEVGAEAYGLYFSLLNFSIVFSFLLDWGLTAFVNRQLAINEGMIYRISQLLILKALFILLYIAIVFAVAFLSGVEEWKILWKIIGIQILTSLFVFLRAIITANQWFRTDAWLSILDKTLMIVVCAGFIYFPVFLGRISINKFLWIQMLATTFAVICCIVVLTWNKIRLFEWRQPGITTSLLKKAIPFAMIVLLMSAHYRLDGFLLERLHPNGAYEAGIYAGAYRLLDAANMIGFLFASFLLPFITRQLSIREGIAEPILNSRHVLVLFSIYIAVTAIFLAPWIQSILYHKNDPYAVLVIRLCLPTILGYSLVQIYGTVLTAAGKIVSFCYIVLAALVMNTALNLWWIPKQGAEGACVAALISQGSCGIMTMIYASRKARIPIQFRSIVIYIFTGLCMVGMLHLSVNSGIDEWIRVSTAGLVVLILSLVTGLFRIKRWTLFFKQTNIK